MFLIFDTETTGFIEKKGAPYTEIEHYPRIVQLAWQVHDEKGNLIENHDYLIKPEGYIIPFEAQKVHGISTEMAEKEGLDIKDVLQKFEKSLQQTQILVGHNIEQFDIPIVLSENYRNGLETKLSDKAIYDTMLETVDFCKLGNPNRYKFPKLTELYEKLFGESFTEQHNAAADVNANARAFFELVRRNEVPLDKIPLEENNVKELRENFEKEVPVFKIKIRDQADVDIDAGGISEGEITISSEDYNPHFFNFHVHTNYSILQSNIDIKELVEKAVKEKMPAVGMTDFGNLMGAFQFLDTVQSINKKQKEEQEDFKEIIPVVGLEIHISEKYEKHKFTKDQPDRRFPQVLIAKNRDGFRNLSKISSIGFTKGYYAGVPRVSKEVIEQYKENLIATTGGKYSEIPYLILNKGEKYAEETLHWYMETFKDDFYIELNNHFLPEEAVINQTLLQFAKKYKLPILPQNECYYLEEGDAEIQDILLCIKEGEKKSVPIGNRSGERIGLENNQYFFKNSAEIKPLFTEEDIFSDFETFLSKFESYSLHRDILLPKFDIPTEFIDEKDEEDESKRGENNYLRHLTYEGAKKRYGEITPEIKERIDFELETIEKTGYPGYFLIVQDITNTAKELGVTVGPGRGSAAGSVVAYCTGITNIDPIKYDLLFERFLNPDRISMPDIDIDFDDKGREKIINWVIEKYGNNQVAQIITYGTLAGRSAIRDTGRVLELPLFETDELAKKFPSSIKLKDLNKDDKELSQKVRSDEMTNVQFLKETMDKDSMQSTVLRNAQKIEGGIRNTGIHACGLIITPEDISNLVPVSVAKDSDIWVSQFDNNVVENAGLLKMDFLGLRTLSIIKEAIDIIEQKHNVKINLDEIPLDDPLTFEKIFQPAHTVGIFQFESLGMRKHLRSLAPDTFEDLIAMTSLFRPGPMQYIPEFINRKHGRAPIEYDLPEMEDVLKETYGITVYQEQVMLLSQKLANFTKGEADSLRKAMGKKQIQILEKLHPLFIENGLKNGHPEDVLEKIWKDWEAFAQYAFNKSHATCYSDISFKTAYLKAHYPAEFMASILSNNLNNLSTLTIFMEEAKKMGIEVLGPDVNESEYAFFVNNNGNIRFGLGAIKGIGKHSVDAIIEERKANGPFMSVIDFVERVDLKNVNKKTFEGLTSSGAFDEIDEYTRASFFAKDQNDRTAIENLIQYGSDFQKSKTQMQNSLFGDIQESIDSIKPSFPVTEEWNMLTKLKKEKEVTGLYISAHPLDNYKHEIEHLNIKELDAIEELIPRAINKEITVCGMITEVKRFKSKNGKKDMATFLLEDYSGSYKFFIQEDMLLKKGYLLETDRFIHLVFKVEKSPYTEKIFLKIQKLDLLKNVLENQTKQLNIAIHLDDIDTQIVDNLLALLSKYNPKEAEKSKSLKFTVIDEEAKATLDLYSLQQKIDICGELLTELESIEEIKFRLN